MERNQAGVTSLPNQAAIVFEGPETRQFLQGQLSCDVQKIPVGGWTWGGYLTPKGRLLATFAAFALADDRIGLLMDKDLVDQALAKFRMYVLRAKTRPSVDDSPWAGGVGVGSIEGAEVSLDLGGGVSMAMGVTADGDDGVRHELHAACAERGMPWLTGPLQDALTVHMLSLDLAGGVDFDKGCYVGQEIVVRAHHRGRIKRRAHVVAGSGEPPRKGAEILSGAHGGQVAGHVVYSGSRGGGFVGLAEMRKDAAGEGLELDDGRGLAASAPPYGLHDPKFEDG